MKLAIIHVYLGPKYIADIIIGIKFKLITNKLVFIDKNLDKTINRLSNIADKIIFLFFVITNFVIIKSPFLKLELPHVK